MAATTTTIDKILKYVYSNRALQNAVYDQNPGFAMVPKKGGFVGRSHIHAITYGNSLARSPTFATAQGRAGINGASGTDSGFNRDVNFTLPRVKNYAMASIEQEAVLASKGDNGAFISATTQHIDGILQTLKNDFGRDIYGRGDGALGQVTAVSGSGPYTFTVGEAITQIEVGMEIVASTTTVDTILLNSGGGVVVTGVNRSAGTFTAATNPDSIVANCWLFIKGDRQVAAITSNSHYIKILGFNAWNPIVAPSASESFLGVDRSVDVTRLAGHRLDISALQPEEGYITALAAMGREDAKPGVILTSYTDEKNLKLALGSRVEAEYSQMGDVGFESMRLRGPNGTVRVYADRNAPVGYSRLLQMDTWELKHLGELVNKGDTLGDGGWAREYQADRFECRFSFYGNMVCHKPSANMVVTLPT